jgi:membrane protease YdiL (CAAX protease family)
VNTRPPPPLPLLVRIFISPDERRLRAGWRLVLHFLLLLPCAFLLSIPLVAVAALFPAAMDLVGLVGSQLVFMLSVLAATFVARRFLDRRSFRSLGLEWNAHAPRDLLFGIALTGVQMGAIYLAEWALGWLSFEGFAWDVQAWPEVVAGAVLMLGVFVLVGWNEELLSRGYQLQNLAEGLNLGWAVVISSILFALLHLGNPNVSWVAITGLVAAGVFLAYGYVCTRQLWLPIGLHIGWNFFEGTVFGFAVSGQASFPLVHQSVDGPPLWTGGAFGPEAGLIMLPALALGAVLIRLYARHRVDAGMGFNRE